MRRYPDLSQADLDYITTKLIRREEYVQGHDDPDSKDVRGRKNTTSVKEEGQGRLQNHLLYSGNILFYIIN